MFCNVYFSILVLFTRRLRELFTNGNNYVTANVFTFNDDNIMPYLLSFLVGYLLNVVRLRNVIFALRTYHTCPIANERAIRGECTRIRSCVFIRIVIRLLTRDAISNEVMVHARAAIRTRLQMMITLNGASVIFATFRTRLYDLCKDLARRNYLRCLVQEDRESWVRVSYQEFRVRPFQYFRFSGLTGIRRNRLVIIIYLRCVRLILYRAYFNFYRFYQENFSRINGPTSTSVLLFTRLRLSRHRLIRLFVRRRLGMNQDCVSNGIFLNFIRINGNDFRI